MWPLLETVVDSPLLKKNIVGAQEDCLTVNRRKKGGGGTRNKKRERKEKRKKERKKKIGKRINVYN